MRAPVRRLIAMFVIVSLSACMTVRDSGRFLPVRIRLAVIGWNMHAGRGDLRRLVDDLTIGLLTGAQPVHAYVLLLQEVTADEQRAPDALTVRPGLATFFSPVRRGNGRVSGNAILSTGPLADTRVIDLPRERQPRAAVAASVDIDGTPVFVVSTHLENRIAWTRGGLFSDGARGRQAEALIRALPPAAPGIVGGDMNTWLGPNEPAWRALLERFPDTPERPQPTFRDRLVLDHLFFDLPDGWTATRHVIAERYGSDHHPVLGLVYSAGSRRETRPPGVK